MVMAQGGDKAAERRTPRYGVNVCMITKCPFIFIFSFSFSFLTVAEKMAFPWNFLPGFNMHGCGEIHFSKYKAQVHLMELFKLL